MRAHCDMPSLYLLHCVHTAPAHTGCQHTASADSYRPTLGVSTHTFLPHTGRFHSYLLAPHWALPHACRLSGWQGSLAWRTVQKQANVSADPHRALWHQRSGSRSRSAAACSSARTLAAFSILSV
eukprot:351555-Chlamydomonas_euryale.AAC.4